MEGVPDEVIITALRRAGVSGQTPRTGRAITYADLYELGLSGHAGRRRCAPQRAAEGRAAHAPFEKGAVCRTFQPVYI